MVWQTILLIRLMKTYNIFEVCDENCSEIHNLIQKWPAAKYKKCKYGIDTLHDLLPSVIRTLKEDIQAE